MSTDDLPSLPPDARDALRDGRALDDPGAVVRARMRARLLSALPPSPGGGGAAPPNGASLLLRKVPAWALAAAFVAGGAAGILVSGRSSSSSPAMPSASSATARVTSEGARPVTSGAATEPTLAPVALHDLPSVTSVSVIATATASASQAGSDLAAERGVLDVARTALGRGDGASALVACDEHARRYPRGALAEEREAIAVQALVLEGRSEDARARAERFRKSHPKSILLPAVLAAAGIGP